MAIKRRDLLQGSMGLAGFGMISMGGTASLLEASEAEKNMTTRRKVLTLAHLTDTHVQPEKDAQAGMAAALHHVQSHPAGVQLIITGGDNIMDAFGQTRERTAAQWKIWRETLAAECSLPVLNCIGNHDVWGWNRERSGVSPDEPGYGKRWAMDELGLSRPYYSVDQAGWHLIVLDSTQSDGGNDYKARLDEKQFEWLAEDLKRTPAQTPVLVLSHIPIFAACPFFDGDNEKSGDWVVPGAWMHLDARRLKDLFLKHPNVKVCLSGHIHLVDRVEYLGVTYCCNGAVSAGWWGGPYQEFQNGYGLVELFDDGTFSNQYVEYGWKAKA
jgi:3',5'-cyclic AMP phosphodiesterase CpdA